MHPLASNLNRPSNHGGCVACNPQSGNSRQYGVVSVPGRPKFVSVRDTIRRRFATACAAKSAGIPSQPTLTFTFTTRGGKTTGASQTRSLIFCRLKGSQLSTISEESCETAKGSCQGNAKVKAGFGKTTNQMRAAYSHNSSSTQISDLKKISNLKVRCENKLLNIKSGNPETIADYSGKYIEIIKTGSSNARLLEDKLKNFLNSIPTVPTYPAPHNA